MKFKIERKIFSAIPNLFVGVVIAKGVDNTKQYKEIDTLLDKAIKEAQLRFANTNVKLNKDILSYREAFQALSINPNKFPCSVEAMFARISKGKGLPHINPLVDLNNALSLKYIIPMGTHDLNRSVEDVEMRYAVEGDTFVPFGSTEQENIPPGEVVYAVGHEIRTRRWTWRQSEYGKITPATSYVFFPIDGFVDKNKHEVEKIIAELSNILQAHLHCQVSTGFVDKEHPACDLSL